MDQTARGSSSRPSPSKTTRPSANKRKGNIIVLTAVLLVVLLAMVAFAVDVGYMSVVQTEMRGSVDASALAGAGALVNGTTAAEKEALLYLEKNKVGQQTLGKKNATIEFGQWNTQARQFTVSNQTPNAIRVTATSAGQPLFFGRVLGKDTFVTDAQAVAVYQPRDIALVLDYSGSMCFDSQFRSRSLLGQKAIEDNLKDIYKELGSPKYGKLKFKPEAYGNSSTSTKKVKKHFDLDKTPYPYPDGSWDEYILYVQYSKSIEAAGYECCYGYMTWLDYVLAFHCSANDSPGLWKVSAQPVTALKDSVDVFLNYLEANSTDDRVSFSLYTYSDGTAKIEQALTKEYDLVADSVRKRQAGHYIGATNISAGMTKGRQDLEDNGRVGAKKMLLLMTDGVVNMPTGNTTADKALVLKEAQLCADARIPIVTISLGAYADTALMQQVADITGGAAFVIKGGQPISQVEKQLEEVFSEVAADRPLQLVQ